MELSGLRALHFSAAIAQVVATIIMTIIRCYVRMGLAKLPGVIDLENEFELDKVALHITGLNSFRPGPRFVYWKDIDGIEAQKLANYQRRRFMCQGKRVLSWRYVQNWVK